MRKTRAALLGILALFLWSSLLQATEYSPNEVIVKFRASHPHAAAMMTGADNRPRVIAVDDSDRALVAFKRSEDIEYVEPNYVIEAETLPDDWPYDGQWMDVGLEKAWGMIAEQGSRKQVIIAVIDSGVDPSHPELQHLIVPGYDFTDNDSVPHDDTGHGTKVCGIIGARGNNGVGTAGVAWNIDIAIMPLKFMKHDNGKTTGSLSDAVKAVYYAVDSGVDIINASWGFSSYSRSLEEAIEYARSHGILFITSAGNSGQNNDEEEHYPSNYASDNVIAVTAMHAYGGLADFSNYGIETVHCAAPGVGLVTTIPGGGYATWVSGTSFATSFVTGVASLVISRSPELSYRSVREILLTTTVLDGRYSQRLLESGGCIDAYAALLAEEALDKTSKTVTGVPLTGTSESESLPSAESGGSGGCMVTSVKGSGSSVVLIVCMVVVVLLQVPRQKNLE
ncbi:MAG: S8 family peptidase [Desulfomonilia bacterium]|nr:S8 family peptidase [Desulfomonilia bacterium]